MRNKTLKETLNVVEQRFRIIIDLKNLWCNLYSIPSNTYMTFKDFFYVHSQTLNESKMIKSKMMFCATNSNLSDSRWPFTMKQEATHTAQYIFLYIIPTS